VSPHPTTPVASALTDGRKLVFVMVGLPARGKTYTAQKVARYLAWHGVRAKVFNVGNYRRTVFAGYQSHSFFDPSNAKGMSARRRVAWDALGDLLDWLAAGGDVGIYDATNSTHDRRQHVLATCAKVNVDVVFLELTCDDPLIINANVRETKLSSPDYTDVDPEAAVDDFRARIAHYERAYEPITDPKLSFIKLINVGERVIVNRIQGYLPGRLVTFLMNLHITPRRIWLTRHGESRLNVLGRLGGDSPLSPAGEQYATALRDLVVKEFPDEEALTVWTSTLRRTRQTARVLERSSLPWRALDEIDAGVCEEMTYDEIRQRMPTEFEDRQADKLRYRYPRGESYEDVIFRLDPVIIELERRRHFVLIVAY
jgi:predicted kinase